jgi:hypothetical protein
VNWQHFRAFLWLRWRIRANQLKKGGTANAVILIVLAACAAVLAVGLFFGFFLLGLFALADAPPVALLLTWDGVIVTFLFFWAIGLIADLQRSEALSLTKFLHLPVSLSGAFLINYFSSLFSVVLILFAPAMLGLALGLVFSRGPAWLLLFPLLAAFLLMVTALTYQFQGWLATLMANPRRRRTIIVVVTMVFVVLCQVPNLINFVQPWKNQGREEQKRESDEIAELHHAVATKAITLEEFQKKLEQLTRERKAQHAEVNRQLLHRAEETARFVSLVLPPGWLALGAADLAGGHVLPALLGTLGLGLIGAGSLWRAYRTTVRFYTGQYTAGKRKPAAAAPKAPAAPGVARPARLLEKKLPWLSEQASAIALANFRSLTRAPEAKMMMLTPILLVVIFGGLFLSRPTTVPEEARPLTAFGAMAMVLLGMVQFVGNQFGFDRHGFRVYVLCGASRRDVLLGKNLGVAPLALGMGTLLAVVVQILLPMRPDHFLAFFPQAVAMYLAYCVVANALSILAPLPVAAGAFKPSTVKGIPLLLNFAFLFVFPLVLSPMLLPLGVELLLGERAAGIPVCLLLSLVECAAVVGLYLLVLNGEGQWLQSREKKILAVVASKAE